jgi:multicomponent Na+:H+ antiporter subunit E
MTERARIRRTTLVQVAVLFAFWLALSGRFEPLFVITGLITAVAVTAVTQRITGRALRSTGEHVPVGSVPVAVLRGVAFAFWMGGRILVASVQLAVIALSPRMPLEPCTLRFRTQLRRPIARATLANSISLVPGTLTVDIEGDVFTVHALAPNQVDDLLTGRLQNKVAAMFLEPEQPPVHPSTIKEGDVR